MHSGLKIRVFHGCERQDDGQRGNRVTKPHFAILCGFFRDVVTTGPSWRRFVVSETSAINPWPKARPEKSWPSATG